MEEKKIYKFIKGLDMVTMPEMKAGDTAMVAGNIGDLFGIIEDARVSPHKGFFTWLCKSVMHLVDFTFLVFTKGQKEYIESLVHTAMFEKLYERYVKAAVKEQFGFGPANFVPTESEIRRIIKEHVHIEVLCDATGLTKKFKYYEDMKHTFNVGFINAPYDNTLHEEFENLMFKLCKDWIVWVGPSSFFHETPSKDCTRKLRKNIEAHDSTIIDIPGEDYFNADTKPFMCVTSVNMHGVPGVHYNGDTYEKIPEITDAIVRPFVESFKEKYEKEGCNVADHIVKVANEDDTKLCLNLPYLVGRDNHEALRQNDFYTVIHKNMTATSMGGIMTVKDCKLTTTSPTNIAILVDSISHGIALKKYLCGYFARTFLYVTKRSKHLYSGRKTRRIPYFTDDVYGFDFSDALFNGTPEEIDVALFKKYKRDQSEVDYIIATLPNFYNLDLDKYKDIYSTTVKQKKKGNPQKCNKVLQTNDVVYLYDHSFSKPVYDENGEHITAVFIGCSNFQDKFGNVGSASKLATDLIKKYAINIQTGEPRKAKHGMAGTDCWFKDGKSISDIYDEKFKTDAA